jgi:hypothetical protein
MPSVERRGERGPALRTLCTLSLPTLVFLAFAGSCNQGSLHLQDLRPPDATLVGTTTVGGGSAGGASVARVYASDSPFEETIARYESFVLSHGGKETAFLGGGARFDLRDDCVRVKPWSVGKSDHTVQLFRYRLATDDTTLLDRSPGAYIEDEPLDCSFRG